MEGPKSVNVWERVDKRGGGQGVKGGVGGQETRMAGLFHIIYVVQCPKL